LRINGQHVAEGHGHTKKLAEQEAARLALDVLPFSFPSPSVPNDREAGAAR